jgi:hypothetical protein
LVSLTEPIRPLKDVWLRPRRVFRDMAARPVGVVDCTLAAAQGIGNFLLLYRNEGGGAHRSVDEILVNSFAYGAIAGIASLFLMAVIYRSLGARAGGQSTIPQVVHVLAYGSLPLVASLVLWVLTALLTGQPLFAESSRADAEGFGMLLMYLQFAVFVLLLIWSIVLQVMGFSEIQGLAMRKAFGVWLLGQLVGILVSLFLALMMQMLFPSLLRSIAQH